MNIKRNIALPALLLFALCLAPAFAFGGPAAMDFGDTPPEPDMPSEMPGYSTNALRELARAVQRTGLGKGSIPALDRPVYMSISAADLSMDNDEPVFVVHYPNNLVRIYPQRIMVWHEVVNDWLLGESDAVPWARPGVGANEREGEGFTISYSPLTGSVVAFRSMAGRHATSFGVTGMLLNGNSVLYDRISRSLWCQLLAVSIEGPFRGRRLERIQVTWASWRGVKERYGGLDPQFTGRAEVLSRATGHRRSYGRDPYGNYQVPGTYYDNHLLPFPVNHLDTRLHAKTRILGLEVDTAFAAVIVDAVKKQRALNFSLGMIPMVALYDQTLGAVRVFDRRLPGRAEPLNFIIFDGALIDEATRTEWHPAGRSIHGALRDRELTQILSIDAMWFAWASFYRGTIIIPGREW